MELVVSGVSGRGEGAPGRSRLLGGICKRKAGGRLLWGMEQFCVLIPVVAT